MNTPLNDRDLERLSEYLDNRLDPKQRAELDVRLSAEPALQRELASLRATAQALRALPRLKPPRHYTLSPETARRIRRPATSLFPALRLMTTVAAAMFALVFSVDMLGRAVPAAAPAPMAMQAPVSNEMVESTAAAEMESAAFTEEAAPAADSAAAVEGTPAALLAPESQTPTAEEMARKAASETPPSVAMIPPPESTATPEPLADPFATGESALQEAAPALSWNPLAALEMGLGLLTLALAGATVWAWRGRRD